jgi:uncharacterized protein
MKNAETPVVKVVLYGAMSSLGSALMAEMLRRQHEVIAILDDLNALAPRPGLRTKTGDLFDAQRVKQSVAGSSVVICYWTLQAYRSTANTWKKPSCLVRSSKCWQSTP